MSSPAAARRGYHRRLAVALLGYAVLLFGSIALLDAFGDSLWRYPVALVPMIPLAYLVWAAVRYLRGCDELQRQIQLEGLGFGFAAGSVITFAYGFLQRVGLPEVSWFFVWPVFAAMWMLGTLLARRRYASPRADR